jgi:hypothetical protein
LKEVIECEGTHHPHQEKKLRRVEQLKKVMKTVRKHEANHRFLTLTFSGGLRLVLYWSRCFWHHPKIHMVQLLGFRIDQDVLLRCRENQNRKWSISATSF